MIKLISFGYHYQSKPEADLVVDVRGFKNPHGNKQLRKLDGRNADVQDEVLNNGKAKRLLNDIAKQACTGGCSVSGKDYTVAFGCNFGKHRSVAFVERLRAMLNKSCTVRVEHKELS
jgi:UPF0042 nucleotide-binding protein